MSTSTPVKVATTPIGKCIKHCAKELGYWTPQDRDEIIREKSIYRTFTCKFNPLRSVKGMPYLHQQDAFGTDPTRSCTSLSPVNELTTNCLIVHNQVH